MDPLQEVSRSKWHELRDLYLADWPNEVEGYCSLDILIANPNAAKCFNIKVYSPEGNIHNGMIIISDLDEKIQLCICPVNENLLAIEKALLSTRIIDWNRNNLLLASVKPYISDCVQRVCKKLGITVSIHGGVFKYLFQSSPFENLSCPSNTYVGPLKPEHLKTVDTTWTFYSDTSYLFFEKVMENGFSYVLYSDTHQPLAWIHVDNFGALTHLFCLEEHRKKGYAEYITKVAINDLRRKGRYVLTYALNKNYISQKLFGKLKFETLGLVAWLTLSKNK